MFMNILIHSFFSISFSQSNSLLSTFHNSLNRNITLNHYTVNSQIYLPTNPIFCYSCIFNDCHADGKQGGAILSLKFAMTLDNCYFTKCTARDGACLYGRDDINVFRCTFYNTAAEHAGAIRCLDAHYFRLEFTTFDHTSAISHGVFYRTGGHHSPFYMTNFSNLCATEVYGIGECYISRLTTKRCIMKNSVAYVQNGGFYTHISTSVAFENDIFINVSSLDPHQKVHMLFIDGDCTFGSITDSYFFSLLPPNSGLLVVIEYARWIKISNCAFSCSQNEAISPYKNIELIDNIFGNCPIPNRNTNIQIGYKVPVLPKPKKQFPLTLIFNILLIIAVFIIFSPLVKTVIKSGF